MQARCHAALRLVTFFGSTLAVVLAVATNVTDAAGLAHGDNFIVFAEDQALAESVLAKADEFRQSVAQDWLGTPLPASVGRTVIHVQLSENEDRGQFWAIDGTDRRHHKLWITTTRKRAVGSTLHHEITHAVLATQFPGRLPAWIDEGIASGYDDKSRRDVRRNLIAWYVRSGNWPRLESLFKTDTITASDKATYATASSLTEFLLSRADKQTLLQFAVAGQKNGWDQALQQAYRIGSIGELQTAWQAWVTNSMKVANSVYRKK